MGGSGGGITPVGNNTECLNIQFQTNLNSPQAALSCLSVGDILSLTLRQRVITAIYNGSPVGAITGPRLQRLVNCMDNRYRFSAEVLAVSGGTCTVMVTCDD